jgi:hypothetical protein
MTIDVDFFNGSPGLSVEQPLTILLRPDGYVSWRMNAGVRTGKVYYEFTIRGEARNPQSGWALSKSFRPPENSGVGDDEVSFGYDGYREHATKNVRKPIYNCYI